MSHRLADGTDIVVVLVRRLLFEHLSIKDPKMVSINRTIEIR